MTTREVWFVEWDIAGVWRRAPGVPPCDSQEVAESRAEKFREGCLAFGIVADYRVVRYVPEPEDKP